MGEIIPRWEWRTFAKEIQTTINLGDYEKTRHVESSEVYVLSTVVDENPKIRDDKMDVKSLQQINDDGLEQWKPIMKVAFPLTVDQMTEVYRVFRHSVPK
jgi:exopolyphosphatase/guanosine-5'-triphosphate,3'-diphosphate pyrophosphatase